MLFLCFSIKIFNPDKFPVFSGDSRLTLKLSLIVLDNSPGSVVMLFASLPLLAALFLIMHLFDCLEVSFLNCRNKK